MVVVHLTSSRFFGGPERQILGLARALRPAIESVVASFSEGGLCGPFLDEVRAAGLAAVEIPYDMPHLWAAWREVAGLLRATNAALLCCHGYKADVLGLLAARWSGVPAIGVSRGWTGETRRVRFYEGCDRRALRRMDRVVCVSEGQATVVRRAGVAPEKTVVIRNAVETERFAAPRPEYAERLRALFPKPPEVLVGAAGRLSPEKGFDVLIDAVGQLAAQGTAAGFVLFGNGPLRPALAEAIARNGLTGRFVLAGFQADFDLYLPHFDLLVLPSYTEGLPNVVLEALAAGVPVVATAVGGTPELVEDGASGYLVPPGDAGALAGRIAALVADVAGRRAMGLRGRARVAAHFGFKEQAAAYRRLFASLQPDLRPLREAVQP